MDPSHGKTHFSGQPTTSHVLIPAQSFAFYSSAHNTVPPSYYSPSLQPSHVQKSYQSKRPPKMMKNNKRSKVEPKMGQSVVQMDTEEDILSWIEERRRKYPTLAKRLDSQEQADGSRTVSASGQETTDAKEQTRIFNSKPRQTCKNFLKGSCRYGSKCRLDHDVKPKLEDSDNKVRILLEMLRFLKTRNYCLV